MTSTTDSHHPKPKSILKEMAMHLGKLQRDAYNLDIPFLVIIEGLDASAKGKLLNQVLLEIDSRKFKVFSTHASDTEARKYPLLHRFWNNTPAAGNIQFYDRGPYYLVLDSWAEGNIDEKKLDHYWQEINAFERQLHDGGTHIVKLFLTVPQKEQAKRFKTLQKNPKTAWRVTEKDWRRHRMYDSYIDTVKSMMKKTSPSYAKWHRVDTKDFQGALIEVYGRIIDKLEDAIKKASHKKAYSKNWIHHTGKNFLEATKFEEPMDRALYKKTLAERQETIHDLVHVVHERKLPVVLAFCGWDAAGKGGCIKRLIQSIDPRGYDVFPVAAPSKLELSHNYLWRFWKEMPPQGKIAIFDRSWYGRVLVERVEGLCTNEEWQRAYQEINEMESHLADFGTLVIKFWLQIDKDTQLERFEARIDNPFKSWKITDEDWRNRKKWDRYEESVNEMIEKTDTPKAPWVIIPANCKMTARIKTLDTIISGLTTALKKKNLASPPL